MEKLNKIVVSSSTFQTSEALSNKIRNSFFKNGEVIPTNLRSGLFYTHPAPVGQVYLFDLELSEKDAQETLGFLPLVLSRIKRASPNSDFVEWSYMGAKIPEEIRSLVGTVLFPTDLGSCATLFEGYLREKYQF
jgi:hypothetical protein